MCEICWTVIRSSQDVKNFCSNHMPLIRKDQVSLFIGLVSAVINYHPQIKIPQGTVMGEVGKTKSGREFYKFWCIPYGKHERFEPSEPADPWEGVLDGTFCDARCPQVKIPGLEVFVMDVPENEADCLILNVFIPAKIEEGAKLPVMIWIHGGYFISGSGLDYSGEYFLEYDIVLVTINYRLGALGFLTSGDGILESNLGLKDQVLAMQWVKNNIDHFGGNPNKITIFGQSAGGVSISHLVLSPLTTGLFHRAIAQSGSSINPFGYQLNPRATFAAFAEALNCTGATVQESVACLKTADMEDIKALVSKTKWLVEFLYPMFPAIEWDTPQKSGKKFLPDHPRKMLKGGYFNNVPFMIGVVEDEGALQAGFAAKDPELVVDLNQRFEEIGAIAMGIDGLNISKENMQKGLKKIREFYFGDGEISSANSDGLINLYSDAWFVSSLDFTVRHHSKQAPVYPYIFVKHGGLKVTDVLTGNTLNRAVVSHGEEMQYQFMASLASSEKDTLFANRFIKLWISFAIDGKPTALWENEEVWPPAERNTWDYKYMLINDSLSLAVNPYKERAMLRYELDENEWNEFQQKKE